jgi:hypothetical protein
MRLIRAVPFQIGLFEHVVKEVDIVSIPREYGTYAVTDMIDVTSLGDLPYHAHIAGWCELFDVTKRLLLRAAPEEISAALDGGGSYLWINENGVYSCQTKADYRERKDYDELCAAYDDAINRTQYDEDDEGVE